MGGWIASCVSLPYYRSTRYCCTAVVLLYCCCTGLWVGRSFRSCRVLLSWGCCRVSTRVRAFFLFLFLPVRIPAPRWHSSAYHYLVVNINTINTTERIHSQIIMVNPAVALNIMHVYTLIFHPKVVFYCGTEWYRFYGMGVLYCYRRFLTVICLIIPPSSSRPARHAGGAREVFDGGLPCCSVCVFAFNYFSSRFSWLHSQAVQRCGIVF